MEEWNFPVTGRLYLQPVGAKKRSLAQKFGEQ